MAERHPQGLAWQRPEDLYGLVIGAQLGNPVNPQLQPAISEGLILWQSAAEDEMNLKKLVTGRLDVVVMDGTATRPVYLTPEQLAIVSPLTLKAMSQPHYIQDFHLALSRRSWLAKQMAQINNAINDMHARGELEVLTRW